MNDSQLSRKSEVGSVCVIPGSATFGDSHRAGSPARDGLGIAPPSLAFILVGRRAHKPKTFAMG